MHYAYLPITLSFTDTNFQSKNIYIKRNIYEAPPPLQLPPPSISLFCLLIKGGSRGGQGAMPPPNSANSLKEFGPLIDN